MQGTKLFAADVKCEQVPTTKNDPFLSTRQMKLVALSSHAPTYEVACKGYDPTLHMQCASLLATIVSHMPRHMRLLAKAMTPLFTCSDKNLHPTKVADESARPANR